MWYNMGWGGMWFGWLIFIVLLVLVAWVAVRVANNIQAGQQPEKRKDSPLNILKRRYANGEINREQYQQMKRDLS
jgi:putative membrane protein